MTRISMDKIRAVFIGKFKMILLSKENHEDLIALEGGCVSLTLEGTSYWQILLRNITRILLFLRKDIYTHISKTFILEILPEKINDNIRVV
jgi:hypothetical protein